jgi:hypothetical protein
MKDPADVMAFRADGSEMSVALRRRRSTGVLLSTSAYQILACFLAESLAIATTTSSTDQAREPVWGHMGSYVTLSV